MIGLETIIFGGAKIALEQLYKALKARGNKYLVVLANRESVVEDAKSFFSDYKVLFTLVNDRFSLEEKDIRAIVDQIANIVNNNTKMGDLIIIVTAVPCIFLAYLADKFHHSSRKILFAQFDLTEKTYRLYNVNSQH